MNNPPTFDDVLAALADLQAAIVAEQKARANTEQKLATFNAVLAEFRSGGMTPAEVKSVVDRLQANAQKLEALANDPNVTK